MNYLDVNKKLWNHWAELHPDSKFYDVDSFKIQKDSLNAPEKSLLPDLKGKSVLHLQCHFGQDTLSLEALGAEEIVGLDFSAVALDAARKLADEMGMTATFVERDVLDPIPELAGKFDVVFASYGVVGWHPDVSRWYDAAFHYLKPGGELILVDFHPVLWILDEDFKEVKYPYFNAGVIIEEREGSYASPEAKKLANHTWNHSMTDLIKPLVDHNERSMVYFNEYDWSPYAIFESSSPEPGRYQVKGKEGLFPLVYAIKARKL
jgi:SAM-dependent methyltransferase